MKLTIDGETRLLVLTGAGVSAESGVPTFRDANGLWENHPIEQVATPEGFRDDPGLVWRFYSERRRKARSVQPNPGHGALAAVEERMGDRFLLVTQNVDGLHRRAGSRRLVEMHGSLFETRCFHCDRPPFADDSEHVAGDVPECERCAAAGPRGLLRPAIVWFGEMLDFERMRGDRVVHRGGPGPARVPRGRDLRCRLPRRRPRPRGACRGRRDLARQPRAARQPRGLRRSSCRDRAAACCRASSSGRSGSHCQPRSWSSAGLPRGLYPVSPGPGAGTSHDHQNGPFIQAFSPLQTSYIAE